MKLSKTLLAALAVGIALSTTSCTKDEVEESHLETCDIDCELVHSEIHSEEAEREFNWQDCPPCGMG